LTRSDPARPTTHDHAPNCPPESACRTPMKLHSDSPTSVCSGTVVCRCLNVSDVEIVEAITTSAIDTVRELRCATGAGGGCLACHGRLREYIRRHQAQQVLENRSGLEVPERRLA